MRRPLVFVAIVIGYSAMMRSSPAEDPNSTQDVSPESTGSKPSRASGDSDPQPRSRRILLLTGPECQSCVDELRRLEAAGGAFELLRRRGWRIGTGAENHIQVIDQSRPVDPDIAPVVAMQHPVNAPCVAYVEKGEIARSFHGGCTTPLDQWTFGWLMTGNDERPVPFRPEPISVVTSGNYPLRGNHWSVEGNVNPTREYIVQHLRSTHGAQIQTNWNIETWSLEELRSVHDDLHDRTEGFKGRNTGTASLRSSGAFNAPPKALAR